MPTLHVLQGPDKGRTYETPEEPAVIGRSSEQIPLTDDSASRRHAEIRRLDGRWVLCDLNSSNGTFLNGQRVLKPMPLKHGDQIKVGGTLMVFGGGESPDEVAEGGSPRDLVDLDLAVNHVGASILSCLAASQESVILQPPETADAVAAWNVVYKIAEAIGSIESIDGFLERIADVVFEHLVVDRLLLLTYSRDTGKLFPQVVRYRTPPSDRQARIMASSRIINHVSKTREGVLCANAMTDDRFTVESLQDSIHRLGLRSVICVPIPGREELHGLIHLDCSMSHHTYTQEQLRLAVAIGRLAGLAIDNARLVENRMRTERLAATGETVAYLSHHIRNILQGLQGGADVVELGLKKRNLDMALSGWTLLRRNLGRTYDLAMNMLTFSKDRRPKIEMVQLNRIVEEVLALARGVADEKSVILSPELNETPAIPSDPEGLHQVVHNILLNAIQAAPSSKGRVNVQTTCDNDAGHVVLTISDNGPGIPPDEIPRIFDAFHSSKGQSGTGLGLAAARKIVDELSGEIEVESVVGQGTLFRVLLPIDPTEIVDGDRS